MMKWIILIIILISVGNAGAVDIKEKFQNTRSFSFANDGNFRDFPGTYLNGRDFAGFSHRERVVYTAVLGVNLE